MEQLQKTIKSPVKISGVGLHTGNKVNLSFLPAPVNSGINFVRVDLPQKPVIKVSTDNLIEPSRSIRRTSLSACGVEVQTIEHLMAVLSGLEIDNLFIEIDNEEVPGLDGSGIEFLELFNKAGIQQQEGEKKIYSVREPLYVEEGSSCIMAAPADEYIVKYTLNYNHPLLKSQYLELAVDSESFKSQLASSRTFCLEGEALNLQSQGIGKGANYTNTLVVGKSGVIKNHLRFDDEFVRHKVLDLVGDLYILGAIKAKIIAVKSGHSLNLKLAKKIQQQKMRSFSGGIGAGGYTPSEGEQLDAALIMKILPHRYPFLLVDRIISLEKGKRAVGIKNVTVNENFFVGHFPGKPIMPGVLIIEAMAQVGGVMMLSPQENRGKLAYFLAANEVKFRKTVIPGDQLLLEVEAGKIKSRTGQVRAKALVEGKVVAEAELMFALAEG